MNTSNLKTRALSSWNRHRRQALGILIAASLIWTIYDWSRFQLLKERASEIVLLGAGLVVTELCFIVGALLVATSVGREAVIGAGRPHHWLRHIRYVRREIKALAQQVVESKLFAFGFWLNFAGAVGTSLLLIGAVTYYVPVAGWGLLALLILDLVATFGWRIPIHINRRNQMNSKKIHVRQATFADIDSYLKLQRERWNEDNMAQRDQLESRFRAYPQGMLVAEHQGEVVGMVYGMRISQYDYDNPPTWSEITHNGYCDNADPKGKVLFGVDLSTSKGSGAGDPLLMGIARLVIREGIKTALLGGRLPGYHAYADQMTAEEYIWAKNERGEPLDRQVKFYTSVPGLKALKVLPNYFNDPDSHNYGVLLRWRNPLYGMKGKRLWAALFPLLLRLENLFYTKK